MISAIVLSLQGGVAFLEGGSAAHITRLVTQFEPLHALCAGAVGEALGLCVALCALLQVVVTNLLGAVDSLQQVLVTDGTE